ncbi:unnamed protein product, partial [Prorocentrum cordatum]
MTWEKIPGFNWCDICSQIARGLNGPDWAGYSKKTRGRMKREKLDEARVAMLSYEQRRELGAGSLSGGPGGEWRRAVGPPPPPSAPAALTDAGAPPPPVGPPPDVESQLYGPA